jgi:hypothetical protein
MIALIRVPLPKALVPSNFTDIHTDDIPFTKCDFPDDEFERCRGCCDRDISLFSVKNRARK